MPVYYFHLFNRIGAICDQEGHDLPDLAAAREEAIRSARSIMAEELHEGRLDLSARIEIADDSATLRTTVRFSEAVVIDGPAEPQ